MPKKKKQYLVISPIAQNEQSFTVGDLISFEDENVVAILLERGSITEYHENENKAGTVALNSEKVGSHQNNNKSQSTPTESILTE